VTCNHDRSKRFGKTKAGEQRYRCLDCGKTFVESTRTLDGMRIGTDKAAQAVSLLLEGMGVTAATRLTGLSKNTLLDLLVLVGERCKAFLEDTVVNVPVTDVQADEIWSFIYCKDKTRKQLSLPVSLYGDRYCFVGFERYNKLALAWHLGHRDLDDGRRFIQKLARACWKAPFQITTDGWQSYKKLVPNYLRRADFGVLIKVFANAQDTGRYSPGQIIEIKKKAIVGNPDEERMITSHVERHNLSMRMQMRRFTRLTNCFSRKVENHEAALGLYFAAYNFVTKHSTIKTTPAVAAGIASEPWTVAELIERTSAYPAPRAELPRPPRNWDEFLDSLPDEE
jgi:IS1 family transposase/transposase-like protein